MTITGIAHAPITPIRQCTMKPRKKNSKAMNCIAYINSQKMNPAPIPAFKLGS